MRKLNTYSSVSIIKIAISSLLFIMSIFTSHGMPTSDSLNNKEELRKDDTKQRNILGIFSKEKDREKSTEEKFYNWRRIAGNSLFAGIITTAAGLTGGHLTSWEREVILYALVLIGILLLSLSVVSKILMEIIRPEHKRRRPRRKRNKMPKYEEGSKLSFWSKFTGWTLLISGLAVGLGIFSGIILFWYGNLLVLSIILFLIGVVLMGVGLYGLLSFINEKMKQR